MQTMWATNPIYGNRRRPSRVSARPGSTSSSRPASKTSTPNQGFGQGEVPRNFKDAVNEIIKSHVSEQMANVVNAEIVSVIVAQLREELKKLMESKSTDKTSIKKSMETCVKESLKTMKESMKEFVSETLNGLKKAKALYQVPADKCSQAGKKLAGSGKKLAGSGKKLMAKALISTLTPIKDRLESTIATLEEKKAC